MTRREDADADTAAAPPVSPWLTVRDAAARIHRSRDYARKALTAGDIHGHRRNDKANWLVHVACVDAWITAPDEFTAARASFYACPCVTETTVPRAV